MRVIDLTVEELMKEIEKEEFKKKKSANDKKFREKKLKELKEKKKVYYLKNKEKISNRNKERYYNNHEEERIKRNLYNKKKKDSEPLFKLKHNIRGLIQKAIIRNGYTKKSKTNQILGCSFEELKKHLESQFLEWMSWENYGNPKDGILEPNKTWDIDHIEPISNAKNEEKLLELNNFKNLQPLCSYYNRQVKRDNY